MWVQVDRVGERPLLHRPFLFKHRGGPWVFFEDYNYREKRGTIAAAEVLENGALAKAIRVLERPYHLSYANIFMVDEEVFMIPESREHATVERYRCTRFPDQWELVREFLKGSAVDTIVWSEGGLHWFFVTQPERRGGGLALWLYYSTGILEDWQLHPGNPISTDVRNSRGGGAIFRDGARLMRPSQDCSGRYGHSFTLNEIRVLNIHEYRERACKPLRRLKA